MKRCPYCGAKYPNDALVCATDGTDLEDIDPPKMTPPPESQEAAEFSSIPTPDGQNPDSEAPEGFVVLGAFDPLDADRMLQQFMQANIRFQIDRVERPVMTRGAYRNMGLIEIFIYKDDYDPAVKIMSADWKV